MPMDEAPIDVLLVEDNPGDARLVVEMLREESSSRFNLKLAATVGDACDHLNGDHPIDVVLLDLSLPDETGLDTVRRIVATSGAASVVVMTGAGDDELGRAAMHAGAQDYLVKGQVDGRMLRRALRYAIERHQMKRQLENLSLKDDLTGLNNRRGFLLLAEQQLKVSRRNRVGFLLLFVDLDELKHINDTLGHAEGNRAISEAADVLRACFRQSDLVARLGGDEFAAFTLASSESSEQVLRARLEACLASVNAQQDRLYPLNFSVGVLSCDASETGSVESLLEKADELMYREKKTKGRGR